ncbi:MAG: hypothetical protein ACREBK_07795, partial [Sphingomicrobium sp.]
MKVLAGATALTAITGMSAYAAAPKAAKAPPPIADYWMDVTTSSGFGAGMTAGAQPSAEQVMAMMSGGGGSVGHALDLRLASKTKPAAAPQADHFVPPAVQMGASLPLVTPVRVEVPAAPATFQRPQGRMIIYWGCGEHAGAGQPTIIDFSKLAAGEIPPQWKAMAGAAKVVTGPTSAPGFGRWPNDKDPRSLPSSSSVIGAHRIAGNYSPEIAFTLSQDFMPGLCLMDAGALPSGAARLRWTPAASATGYALAMFGSSQSGDVIMWSSGKSAAMPTLDYLAPAEVKRLVAAGAVLPPGTSEC